MELTQRFECTQELYHSNSDKITPDQIGFLGICGKKYPVQKGPNKIGRDPETCNIVLNLNSISRHHAVINVLNNHDFMLMDLDSANKTKLNGKSLQPYIPSPLKNGDMVQFGQVFGVFRLFEEENDLPMTQAIDVPETPIQNKCVSKINNQFTTIPESPDVSDKDDSFIGGSQQKTNSVFGSSKDNLLKKCGKTISIEPLGTNKIDNVYWTSSKKSESFISQCNMSNNVNTSAIPENIHELETQLPFINKDDSNDSIYNAITQVDPNRPLAIHEMETQLPDDLPEVTKINDQQNVQLDFLIDNKENENICNEEAQHTKLSTKENDNCNIKSNPDNKELKEDLDVSNDIILFDEIDSPCPDDDLESQSLVIPENLINNEELQTVGEDVNEHKDAKCENPTVSPKPDCATVNPTDGDDDIFIAMTQKIQTETNDDDATDCEDEPEPPKTVNNQVPDDDLTDCEDELENLKPNSTVQFEDMCTQVLEEVSVNNQDDNVSKDVFKKPIALDDMPTQVIEEDKTDGKSISELPTQVLDENPPTYNCFEEAMTQEMYSQEIVNFKKPFGSPIVKKTKASLTLVKKLSKIIESESIAEDEDNDIYYAATQQLFDDLCSQKEPSPDVKKPTTPKAVTSKQIEVKNLKRDSQESDEGIGLEESVKKSNSTSSDSNKADVNKEDNKGTLRKRKSEKLEKTESKEKVNKVNHKNSETSVKQSKTKKGSDRNSLNMTKREERNSGDIRLYLNKNNESECLPSRSSSRIRKPTTRLKDSDEDSQKLCNSLFGAKTIEDAEIKKNKSEEKLPSKEKYKSTTEKNKSTTDSNKVKTPKDKTKDVTISLERETKSDDKPRRSRRNKEKNEVVKDKAVIVIDENKNNGVKTRNSRGRNKKTNDDQKSQSSTEKIETESKTRPQSKETREMSPEKETRRSRKHRTSKKSEEMVHTKSDTLSNGHEHSTVYNVSSESGIDSPNKLKRSAEFEYPSAKKTKVTTSLRSNPARKVKTHFVLFTAFPCEEVRVKLEKLGATIVTDVSKCTVVLTMQIKRTFKLLCALGLGKPVVGPSWVQACADTNMIVDPWQYLIKDEVTEKKFQFDLERSLSGKRNFLSGYNISSTPNVMPNAEEMKLIVQCSGGNWKEEGPLWICVSCSADKSLWPVLKKKGAIIVSTEFILGGVLRQKLEIDKNRLA